MRYLLSVGDRPQHHCRHVFRSEAESILEHRCRNRQPRGVDAEHFTGIAGVSMPTNRCGFKVEVFSSHLGAHTEHPSMCKQSKEAIVDQRRSSTQQLHLTSAEHLIDSEIPHLLVTQVEGTVELLLCPIFGRHTGQCRGGTGCADQLGITHRNPRSSALSADGCTIPRQRTRWWCQSRARAPNS